MSCKNFITAHFQFLLTNAVKESIIHLKITVQHDIREFAQFILVNGIKSNLVETENGGSTTGCK